MRQKCDSKTSRPSPKLFARRKLLCVILLIESSGWCRMMMLSGKPIDLSAKLSLLYRGKNKAQQELVLLFNWRGAPSGAPPYMCSTPECALGLTIAFFSFFWPICKSVTQVFWVKSVCSLSFPNFSPGRKEAIQNLISSFCHFVEEKDDWPRDSRFLFVTCKVNDWASQF